MILTYEEIRKAAEFVAEQMWPESGYVGWTEDDAVFHRKFIEACLEKLRGGVEMPEPFGLFCGVRHDPPKTKEFWGMLNENARQETKCDLFTRDQLLQYGAAQRLAVSEREICTWTEQDDEFMFGTYASSCGEVWSFIDGDVKENRITYCHHCGGKVVPASPQEQT